MLKMALVQFFILLFSHHFTNSYNDRHLTTQYPLYYTEQQDQCREPSYWTLPGSRTVGASQAYANWTDQDLAGPSSSHFPFILDPHPQHQQHMGQYQPHEVRDREWTAAQRAAREYDRGFLREGWQRRWESCSPVRYSRDVSAKRNDSSYRELEAWAARYSHSLPRRRRIEAEMRGASQGLLDSSRATERDNRSGTDPRIAALQQVIHSANIKESGLWNRAGRLQGSIHHPSQTPATGTGHMLNLKDQTSFQRRVLSQPPGYIAPPPYSGPQKSLPALSHRDTGGEQEGRKQSYWPHPAVKTQDTSEDYRKEDKENLTKSDADHAFPKLEGLRHLRKETEALQEGTPVTIQKPNIQFEGMLSLQHPQLLYSTQNQSEELSPKVIEGRKFRLNKKTGGMTIFCLVSRIADSSENPSLPICTLQTSFKNTGIEGATTQSSVANPTRKLADEVDFIVPTLREQSGASNTINAVTEQETAACLVNEMPEDNSLTKTETDVVPKEQENDADCTSERQVAHPVLSSSVKYPLWREPSFLIKSETETSSTCLTASNKEGESDTLHDREVSTQVPSNDAEGKTLEMGKATESEDCECTAAADTSCVVVKMELISSPKKEHVHYFDSAPHPEHSPPDIQTTVSAESNSQSNQDLTTDQSAETELVHSAECPESELESGLKKEETLEDENKISIPNMSSFSVYERESMEERAQRILGIPLDDGFTELRSDDTAPLSKDTEVEPLLTKEIGSDDAAKEILEEVSEEEPSQTQLDDAQTKDAVCLQESEDTSTIDDNKNAEVLAGPQEEMSPVYEVNNNVLERETSTKILPESKKTDDLCLKSDCEEDTTKQVQTENPPVENKATTEELSQCSSSPTEFSSLLSPPSDSKPPDDALFLSKSDLEEEPDPELMALNPPENSTLDHSSPPDTLLQEPELPPQTDLLDSPGSPPHVDHTPNPSAIPSPPELTNENTEEVSRTMDHDEKGETLHMTYSEVSDALRGFAKDETEEVMSQEHSDSGELVNVGCVEEVYVANEDKTKGNNKCQRDDTMEEAVQISQENTTEVNILHQQHECVKEQHCFCVEGGSMIAEQESEEVKVNSVEQIKTFQAGNKVPLESLPQLADSYTDRSQHPKKVERTTGLSEQPASQEKTSDIQSETEVNIMNEEHINDQEGKAGPVEIYMTEEHLQNEAIKDSSAQLEETVCKENAADSQSHVLQNIEPKTNFSICSPPSHSDTDVILSSELPSPAHLPLDSDTEAVCLVKTDTVSEAVPAAAITESVPPRLHLVSSSPSAVSSPILLPRSSPLLPPVECDSVNFLLKEEPQYPKSLWDAVNRIRKHTAPDSENEEEEVSELWDPVSVGEDMACPGLAQDMHFERRSTDEDRRQEGSREGGLDSEESGDIRQLPYDAELLEHAAEDTLSCSSASSHGSEDTVIIADEEVGDLSSNTGTAIKTTSEEEEAKEEQCCPPEVKGGSAAQGEDESRDQYQKIDLGE